MQKENIRHIVEMGLTLLAQASMPLKFQEQAFETTVYLINRLPTLVLKNRSSYQALYYQKPNLIHLKVFGSECFPYTCPYNIYKLEFRSKPCFFLGYSLSHKGYKCFHLEIGRTFISRHVIFNELSFPFNNLQSKIIHSKPPTHVTILTHFDPCSSNVPSQSLPSISQQSQIPNSSTIDTSSSEESPTQNFDTLVPADPHISTLSTHPI